MTAQIANILKERLASISNGLDGEGAPIPDGLIFIDKMAGLVQVGEKLQPIEIQGGFLVSKFPISVDVDYDECMNSSCYKDLVPNSQLKGILYFESLSTTPGISRHGQFSYSTKLRLVCWINNKLIQGNSCKSISHKLITKIRTSLEKGIFNVGDFNSIKVSATNVIDNDLKLFSQYTYPKDSLKFLMHPYEAFGIDYKIDYSISENCFDELVLNPATC